MRIPNWAATLVALGLVVLVWPRSPEGHELFRFADPDIVESSGVVVLDDGLLVTTNDSGDTGRVFVVDDAGETVGETRWGDAVDVEALAPAGRGEVWVGDVGDNRGVRDTVSVVRVPVGRGERSGGTAYDLVYPDGPRDAEALLAHPRTGQLFVVSKVVFGGTVYAAPHDLVPGQTHRLRALGEVAGLVTDGAFLPDGEHLVLRTYDRALVYTFPGLEQVGEFDLPDQQQGEGLAVVDEQTVVVTSEGVRSAVLAVPLPADLVAPTATPSPTGTPDPITPSPVAVDPLDPDGDSVVEAPDREVWPWVLGLLVFAGAVAVGIRSLRP